MIILLGYMGSGKSAVGKALAAKLGKTFIDFDDYIEAKEGSSISEIFKQKGEIYFRKQESFYLKHLLTENLDVVVSLGGGTPCYAGNMAHILATTEHVFYLNVAITNLSARLGQEKAHRPMIAHLNEEELLEFIGKHLFERNVFYQQAHKTINATNKTLEAIANEIIAQL